MKRIVVFALVLNAALLGVIAHQLVAIAGGGAVATQNGDTNGDGSRDITDAVYLLSWLFTGGDEPVALAQQGGNDEEVAQLRAMVTNMFRDFEGLREDLHPVAFSGNYEELENVPAAQGGDCCEQEASWLTDILRATEWSSGGDDPTNGIYHHNFNGVDLTNVTFHFFYPLVSCTFRDADLRGATLPDIMRDVDFRGANLANARIGSTGSQGNRRLPGVGKAHGLNFEGANLQGAILGHRDYDFTNFRGADLSGQDLRQKRFNSSNLTEANLSGADLTGADLRGANVEGANFRGARGLNLEGTIGVPAFMP